MRKGASEIVKVPVSAITVLNPRARNKRVFNELVKSIAHLGLKKPITVSRRNGDGSFDLVCGQGRLEAFIALGQAEIPSVVIEATAEDCFVMSLVENLARRHHSSLELINEIVSLKQRGYSINQIAAKTDFSTEYIYALCYLLEHGEERLLTAVEKGIIPHSIAMEIAKAKDSDVQKALADAYETGILPGNQVLAIRKIIEQRNLTGKGLHLVGRRQSTKKSVTSGALIRADVLPGIPATDKLGPSIGDGPCDAADSRKNRSLRSWPNTRLGLRRRTCAASTGSAMRLSTIGRQSSAA